MAATPVPQFLSPYAPEGSLNRFRGALGKDMLTTSSTNRRAPAFLRNFLVFISANELQIQISLLFPCPARRYPIGKPKPMHTPIPARNTQRACALSFPRVQLGGLAFRLPANRRLLPSPAKPLCPISSGVTQWYGQHLRKRT